MQNSFSIGMTTKQLGVTIVSDHGNRKYLHLTQYTKNCKSMTCIITVDHDFLGQVEGDTVLPENQFI